jgi:hypothetical protein
MTVSAEEFIRRFLVHVLPKGFVRIRHFGFMANAHRFASLERCRRLLSMAPVISSTDVAPAPAGRFCPNCRGLMIVVERFTADQSMWKLVSECFSDTS